MIRKYPDILGDLISVAPNVTGFFRMVRAWKQRYLDKLTRSVYTILWTLICLCVREIVGGVKLS